MQMATKRCEGVSGAFLLMAIVWILSFMIAVLGIEISALRVGALQWMLMLAFQGVVLNLFVAGKRLSTHILVMTFEMHWVYALSGIPMSFCSGPYTEATQLYILAVGTMAGVLLWWRLGSSSSSGIWRRERGQESRKILIFIVFGFLLICLLQVLAFGSLADFAVFWLRGSYLEKHTANNPLLSINLALMQMLSIAAAIYFVVAWKNATKLQQWSVVLIFSTIVLAMLLYGKRWLLLTPVFAWLSVSIYKNGCGMKLRTILLVSLPAALLFSMISATRSYWTAGNWEESIVAYQSFREASSIGVDPVADTEEGTGTLSIKMTQDLIRSGQWKMQWGRSFLEIVPLGMATLSGEKYEIIQHRYNRDLFYDSFYALGGTRAYGVLAEGYANFGLAGIFLVALVLMIGLCRVEAVIARGGGLSLILWVSVAILLMFLIRTDFTDALRSGLISFGLWGFLSFCTTLATWLMEKSKDHQNVC